MIKRVIKLLALPGVIHVYLFTQVSSFLSFTLVASLLVAGALYYHLSKDLLIAGCALLSVPAAVFIISSLACAQASAIRQAAYNAATTRLQGLEKEQQHWLFLNHELRSLVAGQLMTARGLVAFFLKYPQYTEDKKIAEALRYSLTQSEYLCNNVIDIERFTTGIFDAVREAPLPIRDWLHEHTAHYRELAKARSIRFSLRLSPTLPQSFLCDEDKLLITLNNLLTNALAHTPEGGIILVEATAVAGSWSLAVTNSGPCIPPELLPLLFDKFTVGEKGKAGRSGIGLFISEKLVSLMKGRLTVKSENFRTSFTLTFSLKGQNYQVPAHVTPAASGHNHDLYNDHLRDKTALVMEDDELFQLVLQRSLTSFGFGQVLVASNGEDGTRMAEEFNPNFILLDMQMPGKHGDELLSDLRASSKTRHTPIIAVTATGLDKMTGLQKKHNLCAVFPKPVPTIELFNTLTAC